MAEFETDYLAHHGIKGQKWGVRRTPQQLGYPAPVKRKSQKSSIKKLIDEKKKAKADKKEAVKAAEKQRIKDRIRKNPKKLQKYAKELSKEEVDELINQINFDQKIRGIRDAEVQAGWKKVQNLSNNVKTVSDFLTNGKNLYNNSAEVYNTLIDAGIVKGKNKLVKIGEQKKDVPMSFATLLGLGTNEEILDAFDKMSTSAQNDLLKKGQNRDTLKKILGGETVTVKSSLDDIPPMIWEKVASSDPEERARGFAFLEELGVTLPK